MMNHILVTRPDHDFTTRYISAWADEYIKLAPVKGFSIIDLRRHRASREEFESVIKKRQPSFIIMNGHGNSEEVSGYDNHVLVSMNSNSDILNGKLTYALSCQFVMILGKKVGKNRDTTYIGYTDDFIFVYLEKYRTKPRQDTLASMFLKPSNAIPLALLKGYNAEDAVLKAQQEFYRNIKILLRSTTNADDYSTVRYLLWNMKNLVVYGDLSKKI